MTSDSEPTRADGARVCALADALEVVGDRWSMLVVRELGLGVGRFNAIQRNTGAPREMLAARLRKLEDGGVLTRVRYSEHPQRHEYDLTEAGRALLPALGAIRAWGEQFAPRRLS